MPKILHIGGCDSPHVLGLMEQVRKFTNFKQCMISYPAKPKKFYKDFLKDIPIYFYPYQKFFTRQSISQDEENKLIAFVKDIVKKERPNIIHGHYLSKCAVIMYYCQYYSKQHGIVVPWSTWDITTNPCMFSRIERCLNLCDAVMCNNTKFLNSLLDHYKQSRRKSVFSGPPVRLYLYKNSVPNTDIPRIYLPRRYYQEIIFKALPKIISMFPNVMITALAPEKIKALSKTLGIFNKINFLPDMLAQEEFARQIQENNIIFSMAPDGGTSGTTMQAAYSGAVTIVPKGLYWAKNFFKHGVNVLECNIDTHSIENTLIYAIRNLSTLCTTFKKNNDFLKEWDAEITGKNLVSIYNKMLGFA